MPGLSWVHYVEVAVRIFKDNPAFAANNGDILRCIAELLQKAELDRKPATS